MLIYLRRGVHHAPGIRFTLVVASRLRLLLAWVWVGGAPLWLRVGAAAPPGGGERARVARLCVALVADAEEHDDTYAVALYIYYAQGPRGEREAVPGVTGIPTEASLARTRSKRV